MPHLRPDNYELDLHFGYPWAIGPAKLNLLLDLFNELAGHQLIRGGGAGAEFCRWKLGAIKRIQLRLQFSQQRRQPLRRGRWRRLVTRNERRRRGNSPAPP